MHCALAGAALAAFAGIAAPLQPQSPATGDSAYLAAHYVKQAARIRMRDGARLYTTLYVPADAAPATRYPLLLTRTPFSVAPYGSGVMPRMLAPDPFMLRDGYIFVQQEVRGRYRSEGTFENVRPLRSNAAKARDPRATDEATDAYDTIEWLLANVRNHNGRVGIVGVSYGGYYAGLAAASRHPAIAAVSLQAPVADFYFEDFHHNGALLLGSIFAYPVFGTPRSTPSGAPWWLPAFQRVTAADTGNDYASLLAVGPLRNITERWYAADRLWRTIVQHPDYDEFWRARSLLPHLRGLAVPMLLVGGWYDAENLWGTLASHRAIRAHSPAAPVTLVMGPFSHRRWSERDVVNTVHGDLYFGDSLETRFQRELEAPFFRAHLKNDSGAPTVGAHMFDTGSNRWQQFSDWPAPHAMRRDFHLAPGGTLEASRSSVRASREYRSDPQRPVPSRCTGQTIEDGALLHYMSDDQRCVADRPDVLVFQSEPLQEPVTFAGPLSASLLVSTNRTDLDMVVKLVDVHADDEVDHPYLKSGRPHLAGYQALVRGEIMRARYRESFAKPKPLRPDVPTRVVVELPDVFHTFKKGHRIMVQVHSSWFPLFDRNPQTYVRSVYEASEREFVPALHRLWLGGADGSRMTATIIAR